MAGLVTLAALPRDADPVAAELRRWASEPFDWCALCVLDYVERVRGRALRPRPIVRGRVAIARITRSPQRFEALCGDAMRRLGCPPTDTPGRGDVGLVKLASGLTAAICLDAWGGAGPQLWAARGDGTVVMQPAEPVRAWEVACPRQS